MSRPSSTDENEKATIVNAPEAKSKRGFFSRKPKDASKDLNVEDEKASSGDATAEVKDAKEDSVPPVSFTALFRYVLPGPLRNGSLM
jgi:5-formaminoimidazole-4-carboxamide-1-beta-D-ribofuranosyl 5'-monophosphate synthetase